MPCRLQNIWSVTEFKKNTLYLQGVWRDGRVVDGAALEMRYTGNCIGGSNPFLSAKQKWLTDVCKPLLFFDVSRMKPEIRKKVGVT